jgi:hypothetical protein
MDQKALTMPVGGLTEPPIVLNVAMADIPPTGSYPLTEADRYDLKAVETMLALARGRRSEKREPFYKAAGKHLDHLRRGKHTEHFAELCRRYCAIGLARAYELIAIGRGKPLAELRAEKRRRRSGKPRRRWEPG